MYTYKILDREELNVTYRGIDNDDNIESSIIRLLENNNISSIYRTPLVVLNDYDVVKVLYPLEIDIVYAISKYYEINNIPFDIEYFIMNELKNRGGLVLPNDSRYQLYYMLFVSCIYTHEITKTLYEVNGYNKSIDILEIYASLKGFKRNIVNQCLKNIGYDISFIPLIEDYIQLVRIGTINIPKIYSIKNRGISLSLEELEYSNDKVIEKVVPYTFIYNEENKIYGISTNNGKDTISDNIEYNNKVLSKRIII